MGEIEEEKEPRVRMEREMRKREWAKVELIRFAGSDHGYRERKRECEVVEREVRGSGF